MRSTSAIAQLQSLFKFLAKKPKLNDIIDFLSQNASPDLEVCGVSLGVLNVDGNIHSAMRSGYKIDFPKLTNLHISSNHPTAVALKSQEIQFVDLVELSKDCSRVPVEHRQPIYATACQLPVSENLVIAMAFEFDLKSLMEYEKYFECIRTALMMYIALQSKKFVNEFELSGILSVRQNLIYDLMLEGKSNRQIAAELSYSVSLIRQETMRIYAKLGINGRNDLRNLKK